MTKMSGAVSKRTWEPHSTGTPLGNIRAMFNIIYYKAERDEGDEKGWIAQTRVHLNW